MKSTYKKTPLNSLIAATLIITGVTSLLLFFQACNKSKDSRFDSNTTETSQRRKPPTPPPPVYFYFTNCSNPSFSGTIIVGLATNVTVTMQYINAPGGNHPAYTSTTVNGLTATAPAGTLANGNGSVVFRITGTPITPGNMTVPVSIGGSIACNLPITVVNAPVSGNCADPGLTPGSTGCITFNYRGQQVSYATVRAADGKIWLQQNLGSPQVAVNANDVASYGHYFQWGRWDDGHQLINSPSITGSLSLQNPSQIAGGNSNFIKGTTPSTAWWATGGNASNTWSGTQPTATNGKDPCTALGAGWHLPRSTEWTNLMNAEFISDIESAFGSRLKLTESGYRNGTNGAWTPNFVGSYYWTSTADNGSVAKNVSIDNAYNAFIGQMSRVYGAPCRCVKD